MRLIPLLAACLLASPAWSAPARRPTHAALRRAYETNRTALVEVVGPRGSGPGVLVGAQGHVLTSVKNVGLDAARVKFGGAELPAKVLYANARWKVALLGLDPGGTYPSSAVKLGPGVVRGDYVLGLEIAGGQVAAPQLGKVTQSAGSASPFFEVSLGLSPGAPVYDPQGRLVGLAVQRLGPKRSRALPVPALKVELASSPEPG